MRFALATCERAGERHEPLLDEIVHEGAVVVDLRLLEGTLSVCPVRTGFAVMSNRLMGCSLQSEQLRRSSSNCHGRVASIIHAAESNTTPLGDS